MFVAQTLLITDITTIHFQLQGCVVLSKSCLSLDVSLLLCVTALDVLGGCWWISGYIYH